MGSINAKESAGSFDSESSGHGHSSHSAAPDGSSVANAHTETPSADSRDDRKEDASTGDTADDDSDMVSHVFTWEHGGHNVYLTGTFTGWERHIPMHRSGHDFVTIVKLHRKGYAFKFIVDNDWRFSPEQPVIRDPSGNINNYCDLRHFHHNDTEPIDYERRNSNPDLPYTQTAPDIDDYTLQPPALPLQLRDIILNSVAQETDPHTIRAPQPVTLNHLYCTAFRDGLMVQGVTQRYKRKFVTTVFYTAATSFSAPKDAVLPPHARPANPAVGSIAAQQGLHGSPGASPHVGSPPSSPLTRRLEPVESSAGGDRQDAGSARPTAASSGLTPFYGHPPACNTRRAALQREQSADAGASDGSHNVRPAARYDAVGAAAATSAGPPVVGLGVAPYSTRPANTTTIPSVLSVSSDTAMDPT